MGKNRVTKQVWDPIKLPENFNISRPWFSAFLQNPTFISWFGSRGLGFQKLQNWRLGTNPICPAAERPGLQAISMEFSHKRWFTPVGRSSYRSLGDRLTLQASSSLNASKINPQFVWIAVRFEVLVLRAAANNPRPTKPQ